MVQSQVVVLDVFFSSCASLLLGVGFFWPKFDVSILAEAAPFDQLALLTHNVFDGDLFIAKNVEMVADDVPIAAFWTGNEGRALVVRLLGDVVVRAVVAGQAGERQLVVCWIGELWTSALGRRLIGGLRSWVFGEGAGG